MEVAIKLIESMVLNVILYNSEAWQRNKLIVLKP